MGFFGIGLDWITLDCTPRLSSPNTSFSASFWKRKRDFFFSPSFFCFYPFFLTFLFGGGGGGMFLQMINEKGDDQEKRGNKEGNVE